MGYLNNVSLGRTRTGWNVHSEFIRSHTTWQRQSNTESNTKSIIKLVDSDFGHAIRYFNDNRRINLNGQLFHCTYTE
jgi:hypothetical protein